MTRLRGWLSRVRTDSGQALVEFSIVGMVFMALTLGIVEFAQIAQAWATVQHASLEGARFASTGEVDCPGITGNRINCIIQAARTATTGVPGGGPGSALVTVTVESWQYPLYPNPSVAGDAGSACDAVQVNVSYTHQMFVPLLTFVAPGGLTLAGHKRILIEPFQTCGT
ncbi:MAG: TadE/TadG family type IV pilus assembly protein [Dehalococcoidia bacterium]